MKIQSNKSWYKTISNVNPIFYKSSFNNPLTTIPHNNSSTNLPSPSLYRTERIYSNNLAAKNNVQQYCDPTRNFWNLSEKYQSTKQPQR